MVMVWQRSRNRLRSAFVSAGFSEEVLPGGVWEVGCDECWLAPPVIAIDSAPTCLAERT
jgi:hypothetical protein